MLDSTILDQLKEVFTKLETSIELVQSPSDHAKQTELTEMLKAIASTSEKITTRFSEASAALPTVTLKRNDEDTGVVFEGIPGGHEFTSLIVAILNADQKGKLPDPFILNRMKALKGPATLKTYISLSCENCPDVVQALNLIALVNPQITHHMIDGELVQEQVQALGIQGVPSVVHEGELISAGKISLPDLLNKLEDHLSTNPIEQAPRDLGQYDVAIIGGGPAGASAAIYSARKGLKTIVIAKRFGGQVQDTKGIENLISVSYTEGPELANQLLKHMQEYPIELLEHRSLVEVQGESSFKLFLDTKETLNAKKMIVTTGAKWRELNVPGEKEYLGRGVAFCPHCDGPLFKGKAVAVIGGGNSGVEAAIDLANIVQSLTLIEFSDQLKADEVLVKKLRSLTNVKIITNAKTDEVVGNGQKVTGLIYTDRGTTTKHQLELDGVFVQIGLIPNSDFIRSYVETNKFGEIVIDAKGRTSAPGIYAAGDVTTVPYKQIIISMGEGAKAALAAFEDLMHAS